MNLIQNILDNVIRDRIENYSDLTEKEIEEKLDKFLESIPDLLDEISLVVKKTKKLKNWVARSGLSASVPSTSCGRGAPSR